MHYYNLLTVCLIRTAWAFFQAQMLYHEREDFTGQVSYELGFGRFPLLRVYVPACMLFMTDFRMALYILFPTLCVMETFLNSQYKEIRARTMEDNPDDGYLQNGQTIRDLALFLAMFAGLYTHSSTLVHRFITHEMSMKQQRCLT